MFQIENGRDHFYQWDLNQRLIVDDPSIDEVHFCNRTDDCSLVCEVYEENGKRLVNVPNILLQDNWDIRAYAYCTCCTMAEKYFKVVERTRPADYVYTETQVKRWEDLEKKVIDGIGYYKPSVDADGNLSWTANNTAFPAVETVNIKGAKGTDGYTPVKGIDYFDGEQGPKGDAFTYGDFTVEQLAALKGEKGDIGPAGYTPIKGIDYFDGKDAPQESVLYTEQSLTSDQKQQARQNIGIYSVTQAEYDALTDTSGIYIIVEE